MSAAAGDLSRASSLRDDEIPFRVADFYPRLARELGGGRMLDLGCGRGNAMRPFAENGWECVGVDVDPGVLEDAKRYGQVVLRKDEEPLTQLEDASFDLISANAVFHHMKDVDGNLRELTRLLKPGRLLLINEVVEDSLFMRTGRNVFSSWHGIPIYSRMYIRDWLATFERHGLRPLATYGQNHWASLVVVASSYLPKAVQQLTRKLRRRKMDPANPGQPMMFVLFALQKPAVPPA